MENFIALLQTVVAFIASMGMFLIGLACFLLAKIRIGRKKQTEDGFEIIALHNEVAEFDSFCHSLIEEDPKALKAFKKSLKQKKKIKKDPTPSSRAFLMDFKGDIQASGSSALAKKVSFIIRQSKPDDLVICRLESPGGVVHGYGFAAAQLKRLRDAGIHLTVCVDHVAASGGYMMACVANRLVAAPFAIIGSIGVVVGVPNIHRLLKKNDVDYFELTAGESKRTLTVLGEPNEEKKEKLQTQLVETHDLFKSFVHQYRPQLDPAVVATGEYWYGTRAKDLGLVDDLSTSQETVAKLLTEGVYVYFLKDKKHESPLKQLLQKVSSLSSLKLPQFKL